MSDPGPDDPFVSIWTSPHMIMVLPRQHITSGQYRPASEMPFQWRFAGGPILLEDFPTGLSHKRILLVVILPVFTNKDYSDASLRCSPVRLVPTSHEVIICLSYLWNHHSFEKMQMYYAVLMLICHVNVYLLC